MATSAASSEHFEKLHEIFRGLHEDLRGAPQRLLGTAGTEEKKKLIRDFDEKHQEANETVRTRNKFLMNKRKKILLDAFALRIHFVLSFLTPLVLGMEPRGTLPLKHTPNSFYYFNRLHSQRALLLQGTESLNRATQSIERSHRIATETDQIGSEIIEELGEQRDQLERTKNRLVNTSENLSKSRKILRSMSRKVMTNKLLLSIIILLELAILGGLVYYKFFRKH
uniref:Vesicle transport through interaction with t-SNAREs 1B n=1 Tax=Marmota marmota marmota TaxID=9994 RepID=A0A8C5YHN0_MARMA